MKIILGHKSYNKNEIIELLRKQGHFTCPNLPHYRYDRVKDICRDLLKRGLIKKSGKTQTGVNLIVTALFKQWEDDFNSGKTTLMPIKYQKKIKADNAEPIKKKLCKSCNVEYQPSQDRQKFCNKGCGKYFNKNGALTSSPNTNVVPAEQSE